MKKINQFVTYVAKIHLSKKSRRRKAVRDSPEQMIFEGNP